MTGAAWIQVLVLTVAILAGTRLLGPYLASVFSDGPGPGRRVFEPIERVVYRVGGVDPSREQRWNVYALSVLAFALVSVLIVYALQRVQMWMPLNPTSRSGVEPPLAFNTATSFVTNTNWQNYAGESTMSHFTQMAALAVQNFASAATGLAVAIALIRGLVRRERSTVGNFWVDLTRGIVRVLLPMAFLSALVLAGCGVIQNLSAGTAAITVQGASQHLPGGPIASQQSITLLGTNGGGFLNANAAHPFENPNGLTNLFSILLVLIIPFALTYCYGRMVGDQRQGWVVFAAMFTLWVAIGALAVAMEANGNAALDPLAVDQTVTASSPGGNAEGKETRFGPVGSGLFLGATTGTSTGAVNSTPDSYTALGGMAPLVAMMLGEVSPGGVGGGLYGMLIFTLTAVFIAGLMVGRTPEYLGKKIQANEIKLVVIYILVVPLVVLGFASVSLVLSGPVAALLNPGPHGLTEMTYAYTSTANNNGSAFGGLSGNTGWFNTTLGLAMLVGRFALIVPVLAIAGSLVRKQTVPPSTGTFPTGTPLFAGLLVGVVVIVVGLTYFPVLALGPIVEHLGR